MARKRRQVSQNKRRAVFTRDRGRCAYCGRLLPYYDFEVDHKTPLSPRTPEVESGNNALDNLQITCRSCNEDKADLTDDEYREERRRRAERSAEPFVDFGAWCEVMARQRREEREQRARREAAEESLDAIMRRVLEP